MARPCVVKPGESNICNRSRPLLYPLSDGGQRDSQSRGNMETSFPAQHAAFGLFSGFGTRCYPLSYGAQNEGNEGLG